MPMNSRFVTLAGVVLLATGVAAAGCDKAQAPEATPQTKSAPPPDEPETAVAPETEASGDTAASEAASESLAKIEYEALEGDDDVYAVKTADAGPAGVGYTIKGLAKRGWSRSFGSEGALVLSGPPGGPLGLSIRPFAPDQASVPLHELFVAWMGEQPDVVVEPNQISLAGAQRDAQAFRTGEGLATTAYCLVRVTSGQPDAGGWWVMFYTGGSQTQDPSCGSVTVHPALAPIVKSFALVP